MATIGTILYTVFHGKLVGLDKHGNKYYEARCEKTATGQKKRWVVYKGIVEPSKVPAEWHGWLHYTSNSLPTENTHVKYSWIKEKLPNLTGTKLAYKPIRAATIADYQAWQPNKG